MDMHLRGKVAVISGASIGIGLAVANALAEEGVNLVMAARQADRLHDEATNVANAHGAAPAPESDLIRGRCLRTLADGCRASEVCDGSLTHRSRIVLRRLSLVA